MGRRDIAGHGSHFEPLARSAERHFAKRIRGGLSARGAGLPVRVPGVGLAADVLAGRHTRLPRTVHFRKGPGVGGLETPPCALDWSGFASCRPAMETLHVSPSADDLHDVPLAWHARPLPRLSAIAASCRRGRGLLHRNSGKYRRHARRHYLWATLEYHGAAPEPDRGAGALARRYSPLGLWQL